MQFSYYVHLLFIAACNIGKFGAGCTQDCNCASGSCNIFTGECTSGCITGWSGTSCQCKYIQ